MLLRVIAAVFALAYVAAPARAACLPSEIGSVTVSGATVASYNPFAAATWKTVNVQVTASHPCTVELAFYSPVAPARMNGAETLTYDMRAQGGASLLYGGGAPPSTVAIDIGAGNVGTAVVQLSIPARQVVSDGFYSDAALMAHVFDRTGSVFTLLKAAPAPVTATVAKVCEFGAPSSPTLNFSAAIANGLPDPGYVQSAQFTNVSCTAPSLVRLSGDALRLAGAPSAPSGLDNQIHFRAIAQLSAANAVLDTRVGTDAASPTRNVAVGTTINGSLGVDVNLVPGKPLLAGTYAATLTVSIDPNP